MTSCKECYVCICKNLEWNPSEQAKESLVILRQFERIFEDADKMIEDPILQEICRNLAAIHFGRVSPLDTKPVETIREEYLRAAGRDLPEFFCRMAYANTRKKDAEEKMRRKVKECADIIAADKNYPNLIERFRKQYEEMQKKNQITEPEKKSCGCANCSCKNEGGK